MIAHVLLWCSYLSTNLMWIWLFPIFLVLWLLNNSIIKSFRFDNANELALTDFLNEKKFFTSFHVWTSLNKIPLNVSGELYFQSGVQILFWNDCVLTGTILINKTPSPLLNNKSPFHLLYNTTTDYSSLKVFGCLAFVSKLPAHWVKFDPKPEFIFFLAIPLVWRDTSSMTFRLSKSSCLGMLSFMRKFSLSFSYPLRQLMDLFLQVVKPFPATGIPITPSVILATDNPPSFEPHPTHQNIPTCRYSWTTNPPSYLRDFYYNLSHYQPNFSHSTSKISYPFSYYLSYDSLFPSWKNHIMKFSSIMNLNFIIKPFPFNTRGMLCRQN